MGKHSKCCKRYKRKAKACKDCPVMAGLGKKKRKKLIRKYKKKRKRKTVVP